MPSLVCGSSPPPSASPPQAQPDPGHPLHRAARPVPCHARGQQRPQRQRRRRGAPLGCCWCGRAGRGAIARAPHLRCRSLALPLRPPLLPATRVQLESPFSQFSLQEVVLALRLVYHPGDATRANLKAAAAHVGGIVRLAHALDVRGPLLPAAEEYLAARMDGSASDALAWLPTVEACGLRTAWARGVRWVRGPGGAVCGWCVTRQPACSALVLARLSSALQHSPTRAQPACPPTTHSPCHHAGRSPAMC